MGEFEAVRQQKVVRSKILEIVSHSNVAPKDWVRSGRGYCMMK